MHGALLRPDQPLALQNDEGLVVLAGDTNGRLSITLCRDADLLQCTSLGPVSTVETVVSIAQVPAGRYCLMGVHLETADLAGGVVEEYGEDDARCFDVRAGVLSYPGTLVYQTSPTSSGAVERVQRGWAHREDTVRQQIDQAFPNLRGVQIQSVAHSSFRRAS